jgi:hypothetical protein
MLERIRIAREEIARRFAMKQAKREQQELIPPPRYDEEFFKGLEWLDSLESEMTESDAIRHIETLGLTLPKGTKVTVEASGFRYELPDGPEADEFLRKFQEAVVRKVENAAVDCDGEHQLRVIPQEDNWEETT